MAIKTYGIHDKWTDIDKQNDVDIKSVDGVIESVKINGEDAGGGGGSDFSTAEVEITGVAEIYGAFLRGDGSYYINSARTVTIILYKGKATLMSSHAPESVTGNISYDSDREEFTVTGDGTITFGGLGL